MAPSVFGRVGDMSAVTRQPATPEERQRALEATISCPTFSIHMPRQSPEETAQLMSSFPLPITGCRDVFHCGHHAESTFGGASYFIRRPDGNILVDSPRWSPTLAARLEALGGVDTIFLTHRDDVGDHARWAARFGAKRVLHRREMNARQGTDKVERPLDGTGPWSLGEGLTVYLTPGHTEGHAVLFYAPDAALLAGDHLFLSRRLGRLAISITHNWYSLPRQLESVAELVDLPVRHVLPGHGRPMHFASAGEYRAAALEVLRCDGQWDDGRLRAVGGRTRELQV